MPIDIPDDLNRRLEQLPKGTGQEVGAIVCEAIEQRLALEERKKRSQESPAWQSFSDHDPFVSLIGSGEDDAADVSRKKYEYLRSPGEMDRCSRLMTSLCFSVHEVSRAGLPDTCGSGPPAVHVTSTRIAPSTTCTG
jgi:predicted transcriptional regulator